MNAAVEVLNPLDDTARIRFHREVEAESNAETPVDAMTDAELAVCVLHDPDLSTRRKALTIIRLREFKAGGEFAVECMTRVPK